MLIVIGKILAFWGMLLLILLGLLLFLVLLLLLVPFRYRLQAQYRDGAAQAEGKVTFLLHFLNVKAEIQKRPKESLQTAVLARCTVIPLFRKPKKEKAGTGKTGRKKEKENAGQNEDEKKDPVLTDEKKDSVPAKGETDSAGVTGMDPQLGEEQPVIGAEGAAQESKEDSGTVKTDPDREDKKTKVKTDAAADDGVAYEKKDYTEFFQKIQDVQKKWEALQQEETKAALGNIFRKVVNILKHILPQKAEGKVLFGMDSPDTTGKIYGTYCALLFPRYGKTLCVEPDFEKQIMELDLKIRGRIRLGTILGQGLLLLIDKEFWAMLRRMGFIKEKRKSVKRRGRGHRKPKAKAAA